jgi:hypothetical protein
MHINRLVSRMWRMVAVLVLFTFIGTCFYFRFKGLTHPFAKLIGAYKYPIATLGDYLRYQRNPSRFYDEHSAAALSFDCERIRDDFVKVTQSITSLDLLSASAETIAWRQGSTLHIADPGLAGQEFAAWKNQVVSLATIQHPGDASHYGTLLQALFTSVTIHGSNAGEEFSVETKRGGRFDACG